MYIIFPRAFRSTPVEVLHSILLGPYKYLLRKLMARLTSQQKKELQSILIAFNSSGFSHTLSSKLSRHYRSFVGRDFKALAQCAMFIFDRFFSDQDRAVWLALSGRYSKLHIAIFRREKTIPPATGFVRHLSANFIPHIRTSKRK